MMPPPRYTMGPHLPGWERTATYASAALREALATIWCLQGHWP